MCTRIARPVTKLTVPSPFQLKHYFLYTIRLSGLHCRGRRTVYEVAVTEDESSSESVPGTLFNERNINVEYRKETELPHTFDGLPRSSWTPVLHAKHFRIHFCYEVIVVGREKNGSYPSSPPMGFLFTP